MSDSQNGSIIERPPARIFSEDEGLGRVIAEESVGGPIVTLCFAAATFLGAFLLFLVQPLIAKYILPWFGGGAAVWTTCVLFFQATLLAGYLYAHVGVSRLGKSGQAMLHVAVLAMAVAMALPAIIPSEHWRPGASGGHGPSVGILLLLAATVGVPCVALSATSPLLHAWYSRLRPGTAVYRLYALSNVGSLLALLAYPLVVEPLLHRRTQAAVWSILLGVFALLCTACAILAARLAGPKLSLPSPIDTGALRETDLHPATPMARWSIRFLWLALPACASALLLGTTNTITQDLAPVPFLWIIPLALYLVTFIIAFDRPAWYRRSVFGWLLAVAVLGATVLLFSFGGKSVVIAVSGFNAVMLIACMVMHGELARLRPPAERLTSYYLTIAAGGALGGLLVAIGAPLLLTSYSELPASLWFCCLLAFLTPTLVDRKLPEGAGGMLAIAGIMAIGPVLWASSHRSLPTGTLLSQTRDFYGVLSVWEIETDGVKGVMLQHGSITHGHQFRRPSLKETPTTYYHPKTGVGLVLGEHSPLPLPRKVGAIGLGAGTIAAYGRPGDTYRFYEIAPGVLRIAQQWFTYLPDLKTRGATWDCTLGDGRNSLEREPDQKFDALVLDAFSGDSIPVHLLTSEAFDLYKRHLNPSGVLCVHVSNLFLDLPCVVASAAERLGWQVVEHRYKPKEAYSADYPSVWVMMSPDPKQIDALRALGAKTLVPTPGFDRWTDEHANVMAVMGRAADDD